MSAKSKINVLKGKNIQKKNIKDVFSNDKICLSVIVIFWLIFFGKLLTGNAYIFDDFIHQYYTGKTMLSVSLSKGVFPFWNPYTFGGMPFFDDLQIAVLYPFNTILTLFVKGDRLSPLIIQISILFHYLICAISCFYLGKELKLSNLASVVLSFLFTYSSYMIIHLIHMPLLEAASYLPLIFLLWLRFFENRKFIYVLFASGIMALCILCGYPQVMFLNYLFLSIFILFYIVKFFRNKDYKASYITALGLAVFVILPVGMTAIQFLPANEFVNLSNRSSIDYDFAKQGSVHWYDFITFFIPKIFGVWNWNETSNELKYWAKHSEGQYMFSISNLFISTSVIILLLISIKYIYSKKFNREITTYLLLISSFSLLFALGDNFFIYKLLFDTLPVFNRFRNPGHILYLFCFSLSIITAFGVDAVVKDKSFISQLFNKKYVIIFSSGLIIFLILVYAGFFKTGELLSNKQIYPWIEKQYLVFFIFSSLFIILFYLFLKNKISSAFFYIGFILVLLLEIYFNWSEQINSTVNPEKVFSQNKNLIEKLKEESKYEQFRINMRDASNMIFQRNQGMIDRIQLTEGYGALLLKRYYPILKLDSAGRQKNIDLMNVKYKINPNKTARDALLVLNPTYLPRARMFYDIKVIENEEQLQQYMESSDFDYRKTIVLEKKPEIISLPALYDTSFVQKSSVKITEYGLNKIKLDVDTPDNGFLFLSEVFYPAWKSLVDEKEAEIFRTDYCYRSVYLEKGFHKVEFVYDSDTFKTGMKISIASLIIFLVSIAGLIMYGKKKNK